MKIKFNNFINSGLNNNFKNIGAEKENPKTASNFGDFSYEKYSKAVGEINKSLINFSGGRGTITNDNKERIIELYKQGKKEKEITEIIGCSQAAISRALTRWGYRYNKPKTGTDEKNKKISELVMQGKSRKEIALETGLTLNEVTYKIRKKGLNIKSFRERYTDTIIELHNQGKSPDQIADEILVSKQAVRVILRNNGYTPHRKPGLYETHKDKIIQLINEGLYLAQISRITHISEPTVKKIIERLREENLI